MPVPAALDPMLTQGSEARGKAELAAVHWLKAGWFVSAGSVQLPPPSLLMEASTPLAPPPDQRSCWKTAIACDELVGSTATRGSTSASAATVWESNPPAVQEL